MIDRRPREHQLPFGHGRAVHGRLNRKLQQVAHLRQSLRLQKNFIRWARRAREFHAADGGKQKARFTIFCLSCAGGDAGGLRQRFSQDDAGDERIPGKMPGKHRIIHGESSAAFGGFSRNDREQLPHKNERRAMRQAEKFELVHGARYCVEPLTK